MHLYKSERGKEEIYNNIYNEDQRKKVVVEKWRGEEEVRG